MSTHGLVTYNLNITKCIKTTVTVEVLKSIAFDSENIQDGQATSGNQHLGFKKLNAKK
jgi:hypothetical protein